MADREDKKNDKVRSLVVSDPYRREIICENNGEMQHHSRWWWPLFSSLISWLSYKNPAFSLSSVEGRILETISRPIQKRFVEIGTDKYVWTISLNRESNNCPLVLLHGIGTGVALWVMNLTTLSTNRPVHAIDVLGFGRSSRPSFSGDAILAEMELVESVESWRRKMNLEAFILLGHCFGGYLATSYAIRYPDRVRHLILVDPWGFPEKTPSETSEHGIPMPSWVKILGLLIQPFNPLALLRVAGSSWGPELVRRFKPDLVKNYHKLFTDDDIVAEYIYLWNSLVPTGETAFKHMNRDFGWAIYPMIHRVKDIADNVAMTMIFGSRSWVDSAIGPQIKALRPKSYVEMQIVCGAGHYVFSDKSDLFDEIVNRTCLIVDHSLDIVRRRATTAQDRRRKSRSESTPNLRLEHPLVQRSPTTRRRRLEHNSVCLAEILEDKASEDELLCSVADAVLTEKPRFEICDEDFDDEKMN